MQRVADLLVQSARPILLVVAGLLTIGAVLTVFGMTLVGWTIYGIGYFGALVAFAAVAALYFRGMGWLARAAFVVFYVGLVLGVPVMLMLWGFYANNPTVHDALMPYAMLPIGMFAGIIAWLGLGLFGLATWISRSVAAVPAALFVVAAVVALPAEWGLFGTGAWALGIVLASIALVIIAADQPQASGTAEAQADPIGVAAASLAGPGPNVNEIMRIGREEEIEAEERSLSQRERKL